MADMKDAPVLIAGTVIGTGSQRDDDGKTTALTATLMSEDIDGEGPGFATVKVPIEDAARVHIGKGQTVVWWVTPRSWKMGERSGMSVRFVRALHEADLDALANTALLGPEPVVSK